MRLRKHSESKDSDIALAKMADAFAHPARVEIFRFVLLSNSERRIVRNKDLVESLPYSQATISQHLAKLKDGGFITTRPQGTSTCYYANIGHISKFGVALGNIHL
ncbi:MAG: helix-turn-helix domain-containing protein [Clostridiales Family XIII bacterium]|jgi:DNA-binding transcriptional ArsR family regulator|nr:helix-turn-helix domain-containing protein [Clostridiales Family XIII bacterium]